MSPKDFPEDAQTYLSQLERHLGRLPAGERSKIVQEIGSHLADRAAVGPETLHAAITQLGAPSTLARNFLEDYALSGALSGGPSWRILLAILPRALRSLTALVIGAVGVILYGFALAFVAIAVLKPITPRNVGMWWADDGGFGDFGAIYGTVHHTPEVLGLWIIPIALAAAGLTYVLAAWLMRRGGRLLLGSRG